MRVYIWCDGAAMPNGGPAGAGYVVVGGVHLLGSEALGDATNNVAEYMAVRNALRAAADAGATSAHVRMDSPVVFGHLSGASRARAEHLIKLKEEVEAQVARYPGRVTFARIPRERNGVADELVHARRWLSLPIHARLFRCEAQSHTDGRTPTTASHHRHPEPTRVMRWSSRSGASYRHKNPPRIGSRFSGARV